MKYITQEPDLVVSTSHYYTAKHVVAATAAKAAITKEQLPK
jgi:hypothetical protein